MCLACQDFAILLLIGSCLVLALLLLSYPIFFLLLCFFFFFLLSFSSFVESVFLIFAHQISKNIGSPKAWGFLIQTLGPKQIQKVSSKGTPLDFHPWNYKQTHNNQPPCSPAGLSLPCAFLFSFTLKANERPSAKSLCQKAWRFFVKVESFDYPGKQ